MADGDEEDDDDDGDEGEEGEDGEEGDETPGPETGDETKTLDQEMTDATFSVEPPASERSDVEMTDSEVAPSRPMPPPNPLSLAPPSISLAGLAGTSPKFEGSPLKNVVMPSPTTEVPPEILSAPEPLPAPEVEEAAEVATVVESTIAEPPSTIGGDLLDTPTKEDVPEPEPELVPEPEKSLLPPPPDQVGLIETPAIEEPGMKFPESGEQATEEVQAGEEALPVKPPLIHHDTEDTIKPDDSASASFMLEDAPAPLEAVSEPVEEAKEATPPGEPMVEDPMVEDSMVEDPKPESPPKIEEPKVESPPKVEEPPVAEEPDLLDGLIGELDRQASETKEEVAPEPVSTSAPEEAKEPTPEPEPEMVTAPVTEPVTEPVAEPTPEAAPESAPKPSPELVPGPVSEPASEPAPEPMPELVPEPEPELEPMVEAPAEGPTEAAAEPAPAADSPKVIKEESPKAAEPIAEAPPAEDTAPPEKDEDTKMEDAKVEDTKKEEEPAIA